MIPSRRYRLRRAGLRALSALALVAGCAEDPPPALRLATLVAPESFERVGPGVEGARVLEGGRFVELEESVAPEDWRPTPLPGLWRVDLHPLQLELADLPEAVVVERAGVRTEEVRARIQTAWMERVLRGEVRLEEGRFARGGSSIFLSVAGGPPRDVVVRRMFERGALVDGAWRSSLGRFTGDLVVLLPGERCRVPSSLVAPGTLHGSLVARGAPGERVVVRLSAGEHVLVEHAFEPGPRVEELPFRVPLTPRAGEDLSLEVEGAGVGGLLHPVVRTDARVADRRDLVLFVADTLRRDALSRFGAAPGETPALDALFESGTSFDDARSTASWTLPAHASMFGGAFPEELSATTAASRLPSSVRTLAETLSAAGYRTVGVSDGAFLRSTFGLAQGFERYESEMGGLAEDLETAERLLREGDGRPTFLFVHTYRVHDPYVADEDVADELWPDRAGMPDADRLADALRTFDLTGLEAELADYATLYRAGVRSFDRRFGEWFAGLEAAGLLEDALFAFTSDHGECFGEHGQVGHGNGVPETLVRIPMLVRGPGVAAGVARTDPVSLVDLPRTLLGRVGVEPPGEWRGRDLFGAPDEASLVLLQDRGRAGTLLGLVAEGRKLVVSAEPDEPLALHAAYALSTDPLEVESVPDAPWVEPALERWQPHLEGSRRVQHASESGVLGGAVADELRALGYLGD